MSVLGRLLVSSAQRLDLPDLLSIDSYAAGDWRYFIQGLVGSSKPYILKGFDIIDPQNAIGTQGCSIRVADSIVLNPSSNAGPFFHGLPEGNINAAPLTPELRKNAVNYVYLTFTTVNTSVDTRAFWDPDKDGGIGGEFTQDVNTESALKVEVNVSTGSFPSNTIPVAKITVGPVVITTIEDARDMMYRLGSGGISPNPNTGYNFRSLPSDTYKRIETPTMMTNSSDPNPFQGADKNIQSLKEWMDVVMTKLKELGGTSFWYEDASTFSVTSLFSDALATTFKSKGKYLHDSSTAGELTWNEDIIIKSVNCPKDIIIRSGTKNLNNEQVAYIPLERNSLINDYDEWVSWITGQSYVNTIGGSVGKFANLNKGDWIKKITDGNHLMLRVEEFYDTVNAGGNTTIPDNARSIRLSAAYAGSTGNEKARYDKGIYQVSDIQVQDRASANITNAGGNFHWLAQRSDTIQSISSIQSFIITGNINKADGERAKITATSHGLQDGDRVTVSLPVAQAGTYSVEVESANIFYIQTSNTTTGSFSASHGLLTTTTRSNAYQLQLESANHGFDSGETILVQGTTNFNNSYVINKRSDTQVQFPISAAHAAESSGTATLARIDVRTERGIAKVVQGNTINIGEADSDNIQKYVGMTSLAETHPLYYVPVSYNTIDGYANYNGDATDNLTARVSKLTAMMADKAQDKTIKYLSDAISAVNTANGSAQELTFERSGSTLTILIPGSSGNATIALPNVSSGISLLVNQSAYILIDRNAASSPTIQVGNTATLPIDENLFVIASRLSGNSIFLWNGAEVVGTLDLIPADEALIRVDYHDPISLTLPTGNPVTVDNVNVSPGKTALFSSLTSGANRVYKAIGIGSNITGWVAQYSFNGLIDPTNSDTVIIKNGTGFQDQIGKFDGSYWRFNDKVRYFNGADYWEQSNIIKSTLTNNSTGNVFTVNYVGSEYMIIDYSINRSLVRETGTIHVATDGTTVSVTTSGATLGTSGIIFSGDISGSLLRLRYTSSDLGSSAEMKYMVRRWSNSPGGPAGIPNYSGSTGSGGAAAGSNGEIQFSSSGLLAANANFKIDTADLSLNLNGLRQQALSSSITVTDNISVPTQLFSYDSSYYYAIIEYSFVRGMAYRVGRLLVVSNGTNTATSDDYVETSSTGLVLSSQVSGSDIKVLFTTSSTGENGSLKYSMRKWTET